MRSNLIKILSNLSTNFYLICASVGTGIQANSGRTKKFGTALQRSYESINDQCPQENVVFFSSFIKNLASGLHWYSTDSEIYVVFGTLFSKRGKN